MRFSRTNMRLAAARCRSLSREIGVQTAEFSITAFCWRNADSRKSRTYERHNAEIRLELFNLSLEPTRERTTPHEFACSRVRTDTPATVLCDGDAGLWRLQRAALPGATIVLDWWHAAVRFEHALQAARGLGAGIADTSLAHDAVRTLDRAKWC